MSFIYKSERARRISVPGVRRYYVQSRSQLRLKGVLRFGLVSWRGHGRHLTPREIHTGTQSGLRQVWWVVHLSKTVEIPARNHLFWGRLNRENSDLLESIPVVHRFLGRPIARS